MFVLQILTKLAILCALVLPIVFSATLEMKILNRRDELLYAEFPLSYGQQTLLFILDHLFGIGLAAILLIVIVILSLFIYAPQILKIAAGVVIGINMADEK